MTDFDLTSVLSDADGVAQLLTSAHAEGLEVSLPQIDFGEVTIMDLDFEENIPIGYEECVASGRRKIEQDFKIKNATKDRRFRIESFQILPADRKPTFLVVVNPPPSSEFGETPFDGTVIEPGETVDVVVRCLVDHEFTGFLGRWIIITFESTLKIDTVRIQKVHFLCGIRVVGCVVSSQSQKLSSEAKAFVPQSSLMQFDLDVSDDHPTIIINSACHPLTSTQFSLCFFSVTSRVMLVASPLAAFTLPATSPSPCIILSLSTHLTGPLLKITSYTAATSHLFSLQQKWECTVIHLGPMA